MLNLPERTEVSVHLYKKDILAGFEGSSKQKDIFNSEIQSLYIVNELSLRSIPVKPGKDIDAVFFILVQLKNEVISESTIQILFRTIPHNIVLILEEADKTRLAVKEGKIFMTDWSSSGFDLHIDRISMDDIWTSLVEQIGNFKVQSGRTLPEQIEIDGEIQTLQAQIAKLEKQKSNTKTPGMKYDLHQQIGKIKEQILKITGKT